MPRSSAWAPTARRSSSAEYHWPPGAALLASAALVGALAYVVARVILRLEGHYLAMATLGLGVIASIALSNEVGLTGGPDGMSVPDFSVSACASSARRPGTGFSPRRSSPRSSWPAISSTVPPAARCARCTGSQTAARAVGVEASAFKIRVFVLSATVAAVMGSLYAHYVGFVTPGLAAFPKSVELVTMVVVGGMASIWGSVLGAALFSLAPELLARFEGYETIAFGAILVATMIFLPRGIAPSLGARLWRRDSSTMLRVENLTKSFGGVAAVSQVSFDVDEGAVHAVIGPNGAGKTTLFNLITGVYAPSSGSIRLRGEEVAGMAPESLARRGVSRTFQNLQVSMNLSAIENVMLGAHLRLNSSLLAAMARWERPRREGSRGAPGGGRPARLRRLRRLSRGGGPRDALRRVEAARNRPGARRRSASCCFSTSRPPASTTPRPTKSRR